MNRPGAVVRSEQSQLWQQQLLCLAAAVARSCQFRYAIDKDKKKKKNFNWDGGDWQMLRLERSRYQGVSRAAARCRRP